MFVDVGEGYGEEGSEREGCVVVFWGIWYVYDEEVGMLYIGCEVVVDCRGSFMFLISNGRLVVFRWYRKFKK